MKRLGVLSVFLLLGAASPAAHARGTFDPASASLRLGGQAHRAYDFEKPEALVGVEIATWDKSTGWPQITRRPLADAAEIAALQTSGGDDAIEGAHALRLGKDGTGLVFSDPALFEGVLGGRFEVTLWARVDGAAPTVVVVYDRDAQNIYGSKPLFANVRAIRTGRETTDGWAEYSTGPLDGAVWGVPARALAVLPSYYAEATDTFLAFLDGTFEQVDLTARMDSRSPAGFGGATLIVTAPGATNTKSDPVMVLTSVLGGGGPFSAQAWISKSDLEGNPASVPTDEKAITVSLADGSPNGTAYDLTPAPGATRVAGGRTWVLLRATVDGGLPFGGFFVIRTGEGGGTFHVAAPEVLAQPLTGAAPTRSASIARAARRPKTSGERAAIDKYRAIPPRLVPATQRIRH